MRSNVDKCEQEDEYPYLLASKHLDFTMQYLLLRCLWSFDVSVFSHPYCLIH